jgi:hypothetical protein
MLNLRIKPSFSIAEEEGLPRFPRAEEVAEENKKFRFPRAGEVEQAQGGQGYGGGQGGRGQGGGMGGQGGGVGQGVKASSWDEMDEGQGAGQGQGGQVSPLTVACITIIDTIILHIHTNDAYIFDTYTYTEERAPS